MASWHLRRKGRLFYFRTRVPLKFRSRFECAEIVRALPGRLESEARRAGDELRRRCEGVFEMADVLQLMPADGTALLREVLSRPLSDPLSDIVALSQAVETPQAAADLYIHQKRGLLLALDQASRQGARPFRAVAADLAATARVGAVSEPMLKALEVVCREKSLAEVRTHAELAEQAFPDRPVVHLDVRDSAVEPRVLRLLSRLQPGDRRGDLLSDADARALLTDRHQRPPTEGEVAAFLDVRVGPMAQVPAEPASSFLADVLRSAANELALPSPPLAARPPDATLASGRANEALSLPNPAREPTNARGDVTVSSVWPRFVNMQVATGKWKSEVGDQSYATLRIIEDLFPGVTVAALDPSKLLEMQEIVIGLPKLYDKKKDWREAAEQGGLRAVAKLYKEKIDDGTTTEAKISDKTWNRHGGVVLSFSRWAHVAIMNEKGKFEAVKLHIDIKKVPARALRPEERAKKIFSEAQAADFFSSDDFVEASAIDQIVKRPSRFYGPAMMALSGVRANEIYGLDVRHVTEKIDIETGERVWCLDLLDETVDVKSPASRRDVPIHPYVIRLGFIERLVKGRGPDEPLFHDLGHKKRQRGTAPMSFARRIAEKAEIEGGRANHRWRGTVITKLHRAGVPQGHIEALMGHIGADRALVTGVVAAQAAGQTASQFHTYNVGLGLSQLRQIVSKIDYDFDFSTFPSWMDD